MIRDSISGDWADEFGLHLDLDEEPVNPEDVASDIDDFLDDEEEEE
ncbi:hypothetical protein [Vibrio phage vB_VmeM-Yong XC32]|nr:hypothetical protein [Vibrio phage vB_VmeM-Yong XC31]QAX96425.1 hypothetical protein [Vibrio phage vB_VmeM-Yong XC32]QAX96742.1 hypothetical protein [Vibrio phage vB_VmeM-Yong MS31]QAX97061.1 hypothetical protein [Vibrio phage vB_VmeM-Yong MS32]